MEPLYTWLGELWASGVAWLPILLATSLFMIGLIGTVLPILPGNLIVFAGILLHKLWLGDASISWNVVLLTGLLAVFAQAADWACTYWGAKRFGASWRGAFGALIGTFMALFMPPPLLWIFVAPFLGAVIGELTAQRPFAEARKAGIGSFLGGLVATAVKLIIAALSILGFYASLLF